MSERTHLLVQQWLQQILPHDALTDNLQQLFQTYPYFSAANLLLLKKSNAADVAVQKKRAALHVYNPLFLEDNGLEKMFDFPFKVEKETLENVPFSVETELIEEPLQAEKEVVVETSDETEVASVEEIQELKGTNEDIPVDDKGESNKGSQFTTTETVPQQETVEPELNIPKLNLNAPVSDITFEPFHTVDYFASQGIKLSQTDVSNDQFGKQLKSFTEWLKTMKKLPATAITHNTDGAGERKVENLAAHSLQNADIITESMAEVWVKQGNIQKASEVYNKLSLQNPSKRAYFAAKIESLKKPS